MEANSMPGGIMPGMGSGMLGLEMPLHHPHHPHHHPHPHPHHQQQQQHPFANHHQQQQQHHQMVAFSTHESDPHNQSVKQNAYPFANKSKQQQPPPQQQQQIALSDEEEPGFAAEDGGGDGRKRVSPWQRVKWTDNMVRLLIMVVFYVGDDGGPEGNDPASNCKKKSGGLLQKKGKWKSVSRAMMEKGFYVSPQQCEDKFNDLNKRYKRVNDILGKGTACRVVENQTLLESMEHISPKMKEEVKKLLNSKHLFFREMCAYHNSGGGGGGVAAAHQISDAAVESSQHHQQQQRCFHSSQSAVGLGNSRARADAEGLKMVKGGVSREEEEDEDGEDEDDGEEDDEEDEDEDDETTEDGGKSQKGHGGGHEDEDDDEKLVSKKRQRRVSPSIQQLSCELVNVLQDGTKNPWEQRQWMRSRTLQLEEQRVSYQCQAFELEKQRLKWIKFSGKKEREMERMKLNNERMRLENERMVLLLRQKELELFDLHQQQHASSKRAEPSSMTG